MIDHIKRLDITLTTVLKGKDETTRLTGWKLHKWIDTSIGNRLFWSNGTFHMSLVFGGCTYHCGTC